MGFAWDLPHFFYLLYISYSYFCQNLGQKPLPLAANWNLVDEIHFFPYFWVNIVIFTTLNYHFHDFFVSYPPSRYLFEAQDHLWSKKYSKKVKKWKLKKIYFFGFFGQFFSSFIIFRWDFVEKEKNHQKSVVILPHFW